jgi:hypothetical protein
VECAGDVDCREPERPICAAEPGVCVQCYNNYHCSDGYVCATWGTDPATFVCVECLTNEQCEDGKICYPDRLICVECYEPTHCTPPERCDLDDSWRCLECKSDADCPTDDPAEDRCNLETNWCEPSS